jgi:integration host factor subunit beta
VIKSELLQTLNEKFSDLPQNDVELALNCLLGQMTEAIVQGKRIEIRGFGSFECRQRPSRISRNPKTRETFNLPSTVTTHFKPGKEMRDRINASRNQFKLKPG